MLEPIELVFHRKDVFRHKESDRLGDEFTGLHSRLKRSASSFLHCARRGGGTITSTRAESAASSTYWRIRIPASMVLPSPTSSANKYRCTGSCRTRRTTSNW